MLQGLQRLARGHSGLEDTWDSIGEAKEQAGQICRT